MTDSDRSGDIDDVDEAVGTEWEAETTPYERVREVISRAYTPVSAATVAETARTSPKTARKHLTALAEEGYVTTAAGENGATTYGRSPESLVVEQAADLLDHLSTDELATRIADLRDQLADYRDQYGVESPEEMLVEQTNQTLVDEVDDDEIDAETLQDWQTTRRNLAFANAALSIATAEQFVGENVDGADSGTIAQ